MNIEYFYKPHIDLIYHILAHIKVNNASDLYSSTYVKKMAKLQCNTSLVVPDILIEYYNQNFDKLGIINFIPFFCDSFESFEKSICSFNQFESKDIDRFINPLINLCKTQKDFYFKYWEEQHLNNGWQQCIEKAFNDKIRRFQCLFDYYSKSAKVYFSLSLTKNGRGIGGFPHHFVAYVPFPKAEEQIDNSFFTFLHECTHQMTDSLLQMDINMNDGSHDISENVVILFDYLLIKTLSAEDIHSYILWISKICSLSGITEENFFDFFSVPSHISTSMDDLLGNFLK